MEHKITYLTAPKSYISILNSQSWPESVPRMGFTNPDYGTSKGLPSNGIIDIWQKITDYQQKEAVHQLWHYCCKIMR